MGDEYQGKVFKSGNSLALRLPKKLGFEEGDDVKLVVHADGSISFWRESDAATVMDSLYGSFSPGFMRDGRGDIEQGERDWNVPGRDAAA